MAQQKRSKSSRRWLQEHHSDSFVQAAKKQGYRSRAAFKLIEIQQRDQLIKPGMQVVDLGAAPGGWSQLAAEWVGHHGHVFALDILPMEPLPAVTFIQGDFMQDDVLAELQAALGERTIDVVLSDIAPNFSGLTGVDQPRIMYLAELALDFAYRTLPPDGGAFLVKVFQGEGFEAFFKQMRQTFRKLVTRKPAASRARSREVYLLGFGVQK